MKNTIFRFLIILTIGLTLSACSPTTTLPPATATIPIVTHEPVTLPLSEPGPYYIGKLTLEFQDARRNSRPVVIRVWYPAVLPEGSSKPYILAGENRKADLSGAPYPLIGSSSKMAADLAPYLVTHGFVWVAVTGINTYPHMNHEMIDQPLDILFALDQVASNPPECLVGIIDADNAGAIGYSFDGYNALALSGARIDPAYYLAQCPEPDAATKAILLGSSSFSCAMADVWSEFAAHAGETITVSKDGLWQPMTNLHIRAVIPMAGEGWWLFGERGLAAVNRPTLMLVATEDLLYPENALIYEHLGTPDKGLISFIGKDHTMVGDPEIKARMAHFATAFFGYHLQGRDDYAYFFSEEFVSQFDDLFWGVYPYE
jgi:predicted dienelactone hydrolase